MVNHISNEFPRFNRRGGHPRRGNALLIRGDQSGPEKVIHARSLFEAGMRHVCKR